MQQPSLKTFFPTEAPRKKRRVGLGSSSPSSAPPSCAEKGEVVDLVTTASEDGDAAQAKAWHALWGRSRLSKPASLDGSLLEAFEPSKKWGALVDAKWAEAFSRIQDEMEKRIDLTLRYLAIECTGPYLPAFAFADGISEISFRPPGSGVHSFDKIRHVRWQEPQVRKKDIFSRNLYHVLFSHVQTKKYDVDEALTKILKLGGPDSTPFMILSALFFSKTRWVSQTELVRRWKIAENGMQEAVLKLREHGFLREKPLDMADCVDMLSTQNKVVLCHLPSMKKAKTSNASKSSVISHFAKQGRSFCFQACEEIKEMHLNLEKTIRETLHQSMVSCFATNGYSSEETKYLLTHVDLAEFAFAGGSLSTIKKQPPVHNREVENGFFNAVKLSGRMSFYVAHGDTERAYRCLHEASCELMKLMDGVSSPAQLRQLHTLSRVCLNGCQLLERERRYDDAQHYLNLICTATKHHDELIMVHCEALVRLSKDLEHLGRKDAALKLLETLLKTQGKILHCKLKPASETLNRLGGTGVTIIHRCLKLSVPPRRWRLVVPGIDELHEPKFETITATKEAITVKGKKESKEAKEEKMVWANSKSVEEVVLEYFGRFGWTGSHCENGFGVTLFMLLFWNLIFDFEASHAATDNFTEIPSRISDGTWLRDDSVLRQTRCILDKIMDHSTGREFVELTIRHSWARAEKCHARGVNLMRFSIDLTLKILRGLSLKCIAMIVSLYAENFKAWNGGLPDLMLWKELDGCNFTRFIEVKGPGDMLSERQRAWIDKLTSINADVIVCKVREADPSSSSSFTPFSSSSFVS